MAEESTTTQGTGEQSASTPDLSRMARIAAVTGSQELAQYVSNKAASAETKQAQQPNIKVETGASLNLFPTSEQEKVDAPNNQQEASKSQDVSKETTPAADSKEEKKESSEDDVFLEHSLFGGKFDPKKGKKDGVEGKETPGVNLTTVDGVADLVKSKLGVDSIEKLPEKIESIVASQAKLADLENQMNNISKMFSEMDPQLYQMITTWQSGGNWKELASNSIVDYGKDVKSYDSKTLVNAIMPGKVSEAEWEEYSQSDCDPKTKAFVDLAIATAQEKFVSKSNSIKSESEKLVAENAQRAQRVEASILASQNYLASKYPDADKAYLTAVADDFKTGKVWNLFLNEDGTLKEDAFLRVAMARDGQNLLEQSLKMLENRKESIGNQAIMNHVADTPSGQKGSSGSAGQTGIRPAVQEKLNFITGNRKTKQFHF